MLVVGCMAFPAWASAELPSPLGELGGTTQEQEEITASETNASSTASSSSSSSITSGTLVLAGISAALVLGAIAFFIVRDARSVAPVSEGPSGGMSASDRAAQLRKRRAKAKEARRQRKRNR